MHQVCFLPCSGGASLPRRETIPAPAYTGNRLRVVRLGGSSTRKTRCSLVKSLRASGRSREWRTKQRKTRERETRHRKIRRWEIFQDEAPGRFNWWCEHQRDTSIRLTVITGDVRVGMFWELRRLFQGIGRERWLSQLIEHWTESQYGDGLVAIDWFEKESFFEHKDGPLRADV